MKMPLLWLFMGMMKIITTPINGSKQLLLMLDKVEETFDFHSQVDFEGIFYITTTTMDTYMNIV
jgi:hypothetical protein